MGINDWQAGLQAFLDSNPDLPQGEEAKEECVVDKKKSQPRLDIILEKNEFIVFTEVKLRNKKTDLWPAGAVDARKRARIKKAAQFFLDEYGTVGYISQLQVRFDVAEVIFDSGKMHINYIENAFI